MWSFGIHPAVFSSGQERWLITSCRKGGIITRLKGGTDEIILGHVHVAVVAARPGDLASCVKHVACTLAVWGRWMYEFVLCFSSVVRVTGNSCLHFVDLGLGLASGPVVGSEWWYLPE